MFYTELEKYTTALRAAPTKHDASFDDVVAALAGFADLDVTVKTANVAGDAMLVDITLTNPHGSIELHYRYNTHYFLTLMCYVKHEGHTYTVRWWNDLKNFKYALADHRQTVHDFMRAVSDGF